MNKLLRANFAYLFKNKGFKVTMILIPSVALLYNVFFWLIIIAFKSSFSPELVEELYMMFSGSQQFMGAFNLNFSTYFIFIVSAMMISKEFTYGTIRNKIIIGHKRSKIFLSTFITQITFCLMGLLLSAISLFLFGLMFFGFGGIINGELMLNLLKSLLIGSLIICFFEALIIFMTFLIKSLGATIACIFGLTIGVDLVTSILSLLFFNNKIVKLGLTFIPTYQLTIIKGNLALHELIIIIVSNIAYIGAFACCGMGIFKSRDIK